jgi:hypothetical protein
MGSPWTQRTTSEYGNIMRHGHVGDADDSILSDLNVCMHLKEIFMTRRAVTFVLLTCLADLSPGPLAMANESAGRYSVYPRVVATVLTLAPRGMATIQTSEGVRYEVIRGTGWQVGDTVTCEHKATGRPAWQALECRKTS